MNNVDKRKYLRRAVSLPVNYTYRESLSRVYSRDISCGGMFLISNNRFGLNEKISVNFSLPTLNKPLNLPSRVVRTNRFSYQKNICMPTGIGVQFEDIPYDHSRAIQNFVADKYLPPRPELKLYFEPRFCYLYSIDLSIGCKNGCIYCHFSELNKENYEYKYKTYPVSVDITPLYTIKDLPPVIFLSPTSDPFTKENRELTHEVLSYLLPKGIVFIILTKEIIPDRTLDLIKKYNNQFEGIAIGLTNVDTERNKILEPNCPSAEERLACLRNLLKTGVPNVRLRMDPLFPIIDDNDDNLKKMVTVAAENKVPGITATYIFSFGKFLKRLRDEPFLKESVKHICEKSPLQGGLALTLPLAEKERIYMKLYELCHSKGIEFNTCGCKENRLREMGFSLTCRNPNFYNNKEDIN